MNITNRLVDAVKVASIAHKKQTRKAGNIPYIIHPYSVMLYASEATDDEDVLIACLFHDILEDVPDEYSEEKMREDFGERVVEIVKGVSKDDSITDWHESSQAYLNFLKKEAPIESCIVAAGDKIHNVLSMLQDHKEVGDKLWDRFGSSKEMQLWYYEGATDIIKQRMPNLAILPRLEVLISDLKKIVNQ